MADVRNFDEEYDYSSKQGLTFILGGYEFHSKPIAPPAAFLSEKKGMDFAVSFLKDVLLPEDREIFIKMIEDSDVMISAYQLDQIAAWVMEQTSGRPTQSPPTSGSGGDSTS